MSETFIAHNKSGSNENASTLREVTVADEQKVKTAELQMNG